MRGKVVKQLRTHANAVAQKKATEYQAKKVKVSTIKRIDGSSFQWPSFQTRMDPACARAYYKHLKRVYKKVA